MSTAPFSEATSKNQIDVALVSLPFYSCFSTCYQIELLAAVLREAGFTAACHHNYYEFGRDLCQAGYTQVYQDLMNVRYLGDYLVLARWHHKEAAQIFEEGKQAVPVLAGLDQNTLTAYASTFNYHTERTLEQLKATAPAVVGFSATHYQLIPSLYLAERLKRELPDTKVVLGGYLSSPQTAADLHRLHPAVDWIVFGEGEEIFPELVRDLLDGRAPSRGIVRGRRGPLKVRPSFDRFLELGPVADGLADKVACSYELSRGCYWDKCDFCNFNVTYGQFRIFDFDETVEDMDRLNRLFGVKRFQFLDTSLPPRFADFLMKNDLVRPDYDIFCEVMTDFNYPRLKALKDFGVHRIQVGIETFSTDHLKSMIKNSSLLSNVENLRLCLELGVEPVYGMLVERPGDEVSFYTECLEVMEKITHLPPPRYYSSFDLRPGSPLFVNRSSYGVSFEFRPGIFDRILPPEDYNCELRPSTIRYKTPEGPREAGRESREMLEVLIGIESKMKSWQEDYSQQASRLEIRASGNDSVLIDSRTGVERTRSLTEEELGTLQRFQAPLALEDPDETVKRLVEEGLVIQDRGSYLSVVPTRHLAVPT